MLMAASCADKPLAEADWRCPRSWRLGEWLSYCENSEAIELSRAVASSLCSVFQVHRCASTFHEVDVVLCFGTPEGVDEVRSQWSGEVGGWSVEEAAKLEAPSAGSTTCSVVVHHQLCMVMMTRMEP